MEITGRTLASRILDSSADSIFDNFENNLLITYDKQVPVSNYPVVRNLSQLLLECANRHVPNKSESLVQKVKASFGEKLKLISEQRKVLGDLSNFTEAGLIGNQLAESKVGARLPPKPTERSSREAISKVFLGDSSHRANVKQDRWKVGENSYCLVADRAEHSEKLSKSLDQRCRTEGTNKDFLLFMQELKKRSIFDSIIEKPKKKSMTLIQDPLFSTTKYETDHNYEKIRKYLNSNREHKRIISSRSRGEATYRTNGVEAQVKEYAVYEDYPLTATTNNPSSTRRLKQITSHRDPVMKKQTAVNEVSSCSRRYLLNGSLMDHSRARLQKVVSFLDPRKPRAPSLSFHNVDYQSAIYPGNLRRISSKICQNRQSTSYLGCLTNINKPVLKSLEKTERDELKIRDVAETKQSLSSRLPKELRMKLNKIVAKKHIKN